MKILKLNILYSTLSKSIDWFEVDEFSLILGRVSNLISLNFIEYSLAIITVLTHQDVYDVNKKKLYDIKQMILTKISNKLLPLKIKNNRVILQNQSKMIKTITKIIEVK